MSQVVTVEVHPTSRKVWTAGTSAKSIEKGYGKVMIRTETLTISAGGIASFRARVAFLTMTEEVCIKMGLVEGKVIGGTIVRAIQLSPFFVRANGESQKPVMVGKTDEIATMNGHIYYQDYYYTMDSNAQENVFNLVELAAAMDEQPEPAAELNTAN